MRFCAQKISGIPGDPSVSLSAVCVGSNPDAITAAANPPLP
jgi:hypothetical protein